MILDPLLVGVSTDVLSQFGLEDHSFPGTIAAGDSSVALQLLDGDLPSGKSIAAGG